MTEPSTEPQTVDRETLYKELWETPGTKLARKYGISDVALSKVCRRHDIPRPPSGYWTMLKHGYEVEHPPLPPASRPELQLVTFTGSLNYVSYGYVDVVGAVASAPQLTGWRLNDGAAQRSSLRSISLTFDQAVTFAAGTALVRKLVLICENFFMFGFAVDQCSGS